jgi:hypothetical protein
MVLRCRKRPTKTHATVQNLAGGQKKLKKGAPSAPFHAALMPAAAAVVQNAAAAKAARLAARLRRKKAEPTDENDVDVAVSGPPSLRSRIGDAVAKACRQEQVRKLYQLPSVQWSIAGLIMGNFISNCVEKQMDPFSFVSRSRSSLSRVSLCLVLHCLNLLADPDVHETRLRRHLGLKYPACALNPVTCAHGTTLWPCPHARAPVRRPLMHTTHPIPMTTDDCPWFVVETIWNSIFIIELVWNIYGHFYITTLKGHFLCSGWNMFDFLVVAVSVPMMTGADLGPLGMLRMLRAFRVFRLFKRIKSLNKIIVSLVRAVPGIVNSVFVMIIFMCIFSILAVDFFG